MLRLTAIAATIAAATAQGFSGTNKDWSVGADPAAVLSEFVADFTGVDDGSIPAPAMAAIGVDFAPVDAGMSCEELLAVEGNTNAMQST